MRLDELCIPSRVTGGGRRTVRPGSVGEKSARNKRAQPYLSKVIQNMIQKRVSVDTNKESGEIIVPIYL